MGVNSPPIQKQIDQSESAAPTPTKGNGWTREKAKTKHAEAHDPQARD